jgi:hypothetical protein
MDQVIITLRRNEQSGVEFGVRDGTFAAWSVLGEATLVQGPPPPSDGAWHHIAYVLDVPAGGPVATLYLDGAAIAKTAANPNNLTPLSSWIGSLEGLTAFYSGDIDELRIWSLARTAAGVLEDMQGTTNSASPGLVAYYNFDAIQGSTVLDLSGNGNNATLGGGDPDASPTLIPSDVPPSP